MKCHIYSGLSSEGPTWELRESLNARLQRDAVTGGHILKSVAEDGDYSEFLPRNSNTEPLSLALPSHAQGALIHPSTLWKPC